jgi:hypothetical protein
MDSLLILLTKHPSIPTCEHKIYSAGETEPLVGQSVQGVDGVILGTKAAPSQPGGLSPEVSISSIYLIYLFYLV